MGKILCFCIKDEWLSGVLALGRFIEIMVESLLRWCYSGVKAYDSSPKK